MRLPEGQPPDILLAAINFIDSYQQSGTNNSPERVAAAVLLERALLEGSALDTVNVAAAV